MKKLLIILIAIFVACLFIGCPPKFTLTITIVGDGSVTADGTAVISGEGITFNGDTEVALAVTPSNGMQFQGWAGTNGSDVTGTASPYSILMNGDKVLTATFVAANNAPVASNVTIDGIAQVGQTLTGNYDYADAESNSEGVSTFRWLSCTTQTGTYNPIAGATAKTYVLQAADENKYIKFEVTPVAQIGTLTGNPSQSNAVGPVTLVAYTISASPTTLFEAIANDGSLSPNVVTITLSGSTFIQASINTSNVTATSLPANLTLANPTYVDTTHITVEINGNATAHLNSNDTTFTITVNQNAVTGADDNLTTGNIALDFVDVPTAPLEDWETNTFTKYPWVLGGAVQATLSDTQNHTTSGQYSATATLNHNGDSYFAINANIPTDDNMTFYFLASTESSPTYIWDGLNVYIDGNFYEHYNNFDCGGNGNTSCTVWTQQAIPLTAGYHKIVFCFRRDNGGSFGQDAVWIDDISFPLGTGLSSNVNIEPDILVSKGLYPVVEVPNGVTYNLGEFAQGITSGNTLTLNIINRGPAPLQLTGTSPNYVTTTGDTPLTITTQPNNGTISFMGNTSFVCTVNTTNIGNFTTNIVIPSNDPDENPYIIPVTYSILAPYSEAELRNGPFGETDTIAMGGTYNAGAVVSSTGVTTDIALRIYNIGLQSFNLTGTSPNYVVWNSGSSLLSVGVQPTSGTVSAKGYQEFKVRFTGDGSTGIYSATFNIPNGETGISSGIGDGINETAYSFTLTVNASITPTLFEGFDNATFPPTGWARYNVDGGGTQWTRNTTIFHTGAGSAYHEYGSGDEVGWLVTPVIDLTGKTSATLSFWRYVEYPNDYDYHGVLVSTTSNNPTGGNFVEVQELGTGSASWQQHIIDISAYVGNATVYIGFKYTGDNADNLYLDDVIVTSN